MATSFDNELETPDLETLASLADSLVYRLPGCSDLMIRKTLQEVYRDFCRRSCCLQGRRHFTITNDEPDIFLTPYLGGVIDSIVEVRYNGFRLGKRDYTVIGTRITFRDGLVPYPDCEEEHLPDIEVTQLEIPKLESEDVPGWFVPLYGEYVCSGVLSKLMFMKNKPWSDDLQAQLEKASYEGGIIEARVRHYGDNRSGDAGCAIGNDELL